MATAFIQNCNNKLSEASTELSEVEKQITDLKNQIRHNRIHFSMRTISQEVENRLSAEYHQLTDVSN